MVCDRAIGTGLVFCQSSHHFANPVTYFRGHGKLLLLVLAAGVVKPGACDGRLATTRMGVGPLLYVDLGDDACS